MNNYNIDENLQEHILHLIDKNKVDEALRLLENNIKDINILNFVNNLLIRKNVKIDDLRDLINDEYSDKLNIKNEIEYLIKISNLLLQLNIKFKVDLSFVRGLAYYTGLIFEVIHPSVSFSIAGGGRYDKLIELYGGLPSPAIGFAIGVERTLLVTNSFKLEEPMSIIIISLSESEDSITHSVMLARMLRDEGYKVVINTKSQPLSKLLPYYASQGFKIAIILGKQELEKKQVTIKNLIDKKQITTQMERVADAIKQML
jgi:histidyl-tRNA synthetase